MPSRVLLVDDEYTILFTLKTILENAGYQVRTCVYGSEALRAISEGDFDLAILDYMLPDLRGDELANRLRHRCPALPIIFISAFYIPDEVKKLAIATLTKPETPSLLLKVVRDVVPTNHSEDEAVPRSRAASPNNI